MMPRKKYFSSIIDLPIKLIIMMKGMPLLNLLDDHESMIELLKHVLKFFVKMPEMTETASTKVSLSSFLFLMMVLVHGVWCRRTDKVVDGPNALHITPTGLDRWESRLEDLFRGCPFDMLDAALSDTVAKFPVDIQFARRGRVHLPQDELAEAGLSDEDIFAGKVTDKWRNFMKNKIKRAKMFFDEAEKGVTELSSSSRWP
ncbi:unnamed protein product [Camellia sinensis]